MPHSSVVCARLALQVVQVGKFVLHVLDLAIEQRRLVLSLRLLVKVVIVLSVAAQLQTAYLLLQRLVVLLEFTTGECLPHQLFKLRVLFKAIHILTTY